MGVIMVLSSYFMFIYEPISLLVNKLLSLESGTLFFFLWKDPPYKIYINVNIFNVTNQEKFTRGEEKLALQEVGPYCFQEILLNTNATFHPNGTVTYIPVRTLKFIPERSAGDINIDRIISPNIPLVGISAMLRESSMFTNLALTMVSNTANSKSFVNITVHDYLFGYDDLLVKLAHTALPTWINFERFGILDRIMALENGSNIVTITNNYKKATPANPLYDIEDTKRQFYIQEFNGSPGLQQWGYEDTEGNETSTSNSKCNFIGGSYDGTLFPRDLTMDHGMLLYRRGFCRALPAFPVREVTMDGYEAIEFGVQKNFLYEPSVNPDNACYCKDEGDCLPRGLVSIAPCYYDIPMTLSQPHFYNADPSLVEQVTGLAPSKSLHDLNFTLHKRLGLPIKANLRIQVNLDVGQTKYNAKTTIFNNLHVPLCWLELQVDEVPSIVKILITLAYGILPVTEVMCKYLLGVFGAAMISCSALLMLNSTEIAETNIEALPFSRFSLRRSSEYKPIPVSSPPQYLRQNMRRISK